MSLSRELRKALLTGPGQGVGAVRDLSLPAQLMSAGTGGYGPGQNAQHLLPYRPEQFLGGSFGPSEPAAVAPIDGAHRDQVVPRVWQYPVGYNLPSPPGAYKAIDFRTLRQIADILDVLRRAIEVRKTEVGRLEWEIVSRDSSGGDNSDAIREIATWFQQPDRIRGVTWDKWVEMLLEEVLVTDALAIYPHVTWGKGFGPLKSDLHSLEILDGTTIKPLVDIRGARPQPPAPAYQQFLYGIPRSEFAADLAQRQYGGELASDGKTPQQEFTAEELYYLPYNVRSHTLYGFPPVEQIIISVNLALRRQQWWSTWYTEGSVPAMLIHVPEDWDARTVREFEDYWNGLLSSDMAWKHRTKVVPGTHGASLLKPPISTETMAFDEWIARIICMGIGVTPEELGFSPKSGLGGAGWSEAAENINLRKSLQPLATWISRFCNHVITKWFGRPDLEFRFILEEIEDRLKRAQEDEVLVRTGIKTASEARIERGLEPYGEGVGDKPILMTRSEVYLLEDIEAVSKKQLVDGAVSPQGEPVAPVVPDGVAAVPKQQPTLPGSDVPATGSDPTRDPGAVGRLQSGGSGDVGQTSDPAASKVSLTASQQAELRRWAVKAQRAARAGRAPATVGFRSDVLGPELCAAIRAELEKCATPEDVRGAFAGPILRAAVAGRLRQLVDAELVARA